MIASIRTPAVRRLRFQESGFDAASSPDVGRPAARRRWPALADDRVAAAAPDPARPTPAPVVPPAAAAFVEPEEHERWDGMA